MCIGKVSSVLENASIHIALFFIYGLQALTSY